MALSPSLSAGYGRLLGGASKARWRRWSRRASKEASLRLLTPPLDHCLRRMLVADVLVDPHPVQTHTRMASRASAIEERTSFSRMLPLSAPVGKPVAMVAPTPVATSAPAAPHALDRATAELPHQPEPQVEPEERGNAEANSGETSGDEGASEAQERPRRMTSDAVLKVGPWADGPDGGGPTSSARSGMRGGWGRGRGPSLRSNGPPRTSRGILAPGKAWDEERRVAGDDVGTRSRSKRQRA